MKRRLITMIATLALGLSALVAAPAAAVADESTGAVYVALGDSVVAGTGNLPYVDQSCLRSKKSYPMLLAQTAGVPVASSACAGATTADVLTTQLGDLGPSTQVVTLTVGINDLDWQGVLAACSSAGTPEACAAAVAAATAAVQGLPPSIAQLLGTVRTLAPNALIVVSGYPLLFGAVSDSCSVGAFQGSQVTFTAQQTAVANLGIAGVNAAIQGGIALYQQGFVIATGSPDPFVEYLDVTAEFAGHALCDTGDRWISGLVSGKATFDRGFHPNTAGQQALAGLFLQAVMN